MLQTARFTEKLEILEIAYSANTLGSPLPYYKPFKIIYGSIQTQGGNTSFTNGNVYNDNISFWVRYIPQIQKKGYVVRYNGEVYAIHNLTHIRRSMATVIDCSSST